MDSSGKQPVGAHDYGFEKYGWEGLLASSVSLGWSALSAELRAHGRGVIAYERTQPEFAAHNPTQELLQLVEGLVVNRQARSN